jgi:hypothetical protein
MKKVRAVMKANRNLGKEVRIVKKALSSFGAVESTTMVASNDAPKMSAHDDVALTNRPHDAEPMNDAVAIGQPVETSVNGDVALAIPPDGAAEVPLVLVGTGDTALEAPCTDNGVTEEAMREAMTVAEPEASVGATAGVVETDPSADLGGGDGEHPVHGHDADEPNRSTVKANDSEQPNGVERAAEAAMADHAAGGECTYSTDASEEKNQSDLISDRTTTLVPMEIADGAPDEPVGLEAAQPTGVAMRDDFDPEIRLAWIRKTLHDHAAMTVLKRAELIKEFVELVEGKFGQNGQKRKRGRPGSISTLAREAAARELPVKGKSDNARRKAIERALLIANICEAAKEAARRAALDDKQTDLLAIAQAGEDEEAQLKKVDELANDKGEATGEEDDEQHDDGFTEGGEITSGSSAHQSDASAIPQNIAPDEALGVLCDFARFVIERIGRSGKKIVITVLEDDVHEFRNLLGTVKFAMASN